MATVAIPEPDIGDDLGLDQDSMPGIALRFAAKAHAQVNQLRKYTHEPYFTHPLAVACLVMSVTDDEATISAALLHDTVEDTEVTIEEVRALFGDDVAKLVAGVTDISKPEDGNRAVRKEIDRHHIALADPRSKTIKLADLIHNTISIVKHDKSFARIYLDEKARLLEVLTEGNPTLYAMAQDSLIQGQYELLHDALRSKSSTIFIQ